MADMWQTCSILDCTEVAHVLHKPFVPPCAPCSQPLKTPPESEDLHGFMLPPPACGPGDDLLNLDFVLPACTIETWRHSLAWLAFVCHRREVAGGALDSLGKLKGFLVASLLRSVRPHPSGSTHHGMTIIQARRSIVPFNAFGAEPCPCLQRKGRHDKLYKLWHRVSLDR